MSVSSAVRARLTYANVMATVAVFLALASGTAFAATQITGANIVDRSVGQVDIARNSLGTGVIKDGGVKSVDVRDGELTGADVADFSLSNEDINVFFAVVQSNGTFTRGTAGSSSSRVGLGSYVVDFGHDVTSCAWLATPGNGLSNAVILGDVGVSPTFNAPTKINVNGADATGHLADLGFLVVAVC